MWVGRWGGAWPLLQAPEVDDGRMPTSFQGSRLFIPLKAFYFVPANSSFSSWAEGLRRMQELGIPKLACPEVLLRGLWRVGLGGVKQT